jgi:drug/metabolite transporter (DMT)-like permease
MWSIANGAQLVAMLLVVQQHDPLALAFLRYVIASACPAPLLHRSRWPSTWHCAIIFGLGAVVAGAWILAISMRYTTASRGVLVICASPLLKLTLASVLGHERCTIRRIAGSCCARLGVTLGLSDQPLAGAGLSSINRGDAIALSRTLLLALSNVWFMALPQ